MRSHSQVGGGGGRVQQSELGLPIELYWLVQLGDVIGDGFERIAAHGLRQAQRTGSVHGLFDGLEQLVVFDDGLDAVDLRLGPADAGPPGHQHQAL